MALGFCAVWVSDLLLRKLVLVLVPAMVMVKP